MPGLQAVACSSDGIKMAAIWWRDLCLNQFRNDLDPNQAHLTPKFELDSHRVFSDGMKLVAAFYGGGIYISTNSGATWTQTGAPKHELVSCASSADGKKAGSGGFGRRHLHLDQFRTSWTSNRVPVTSWRGVSSSADGSRSVAVATNGLIVTSTNWGAAWLSNNVPSNHWWSVASSADGTKIGGGIYTSYTVPKRRYALLPRNNNLAFSWTMPSTNFVLQKIQI